MSAIETAFHTTANKSKSFRNVSHRVSFDEATIKVAESSSPENKHKTTTATSSSPPGSPNSTLKQATPILFSTNRGLHLRVTSAVNSSNTALQSSGSSDRGGDDEGGGDGGGGSAAGRGRSRDSNSIAASLIKSKRATTTTTTATSTTKSSYNVNFCDLERWSTNRANTVSLEDTFTIAHQPPVVPHSAVSGSLAPSSLRFLPHKSNSIRFKGYARFDVE